METKYDWSAPVKPENMMVVPLSKADMRLVKWALRARSTDTMRPELMGLFIDNRLAVCCDGFRLHVIRAPDPLRTYNGLVLRVHSQKAGNRNILTVSDMGLKYPNYLEITDHQPWPIAQVAANYTWMQKAMGPPRETKAGRATVINLHGVNKPITMQPTEYKRVVKLNPEDDDNPEWFSLIMPMHVSPPLASGEYPEYTFYGNPAWKRQGDAIRKLLDEVDKLTNAKTHLPAKEAADKLVKLINEEANGR